MNSKDLRVIKTKECIETALFELLKIKPIEKISVIELSRKARINKSTFYLHYQDIHDLYRQTLIKIVEKPFQDERFFYDFFYDQEHFFVELGNAMISNIPMVLVFIHKREDIQLFRDVVSILCRKIYETGIIEKSIENDMKLEAIFSATLFIMPKHCEGYRNQGHSYLSAMVRALFPQDQYGKDL